MLSSNHSLQKLVALYRCRIIGWGLMTCHNQYAAGLTLQEGPSTIPLLTSVLFLLAFGGAGEAGQGASSSPGHIALKSTLIWRW